MQSVQFKRLHSDVIMPKKGSLGAACFDLYSYSVSSEGRGYTVRTGLSIALPLNHVLLVLPRSGLATKFGLVLQNTVGVIDEDYRGELLIKFQRGFDHPDGEVAQALQHGQRVAQAMVVELPQVAWLEVDTLPASVRGEGGFGSTGLK